MTRLFEKVHPTNHTSSVLVLWKLKVEYMVTWAEINELPDVSIGVMILSVCDMSVTATSRPI